MSKGVFKSRIFGGSVFTVILCALCAAAFCGCTDTTDSVSSKQDTVDSSYYGVNYKDTGDPDMIVGNSSINVDHSSVSNKEESKASSLSVSSDESKASSKVISASSSRTSSSGNLVKTTITYYYFDEEGEHTTDTELYVATDPDVSSEPETDLSSSDTETETDSSSELSTDTASDTDTSLILSDGEFTEDDLSFSYGGAEIYYGCDIAKITEVLGQPKHIANIPNPDNPAFDRKTYNYDCFSLDTEPSEDGSVYTVVGVQIFDDSVVTDKGVHTGMTIEQAVAVYGNDVKVSGDEYRYYIGQKYMYLYVQNGIIANIGYGFDPELAVEE